jgi:hypothetical protein
MRGLIRFAVWGVVVLGLATAPPGAALAQEAVAAPADTGFVPVAVWQLHREGFPTITHAWVAGSEKMLRVSWDDGTTWYGFQPVFVDTARQLLAIRVFARDELGRGETGWTERTAVSIGKGAEASVTLAATAKVAELSLRIELTSVAEVSPESLAKEPVEVNVEGGGVQPLAGGGGGFGSCCVSCNGVLACDCSVCVAACHASCCKLGCYCLTC